MTVDRGYDTAIAGIVASCRKPVKEWTDEEIDHCLSYAVHELTDVTSAAFEERSAETLKAMGITDIDGQLLKAQTSTMQVMLSVLVRLVQEKDRRDPGTLTPEHKWRVRFGEVLGNMLQRHRQ